MALVENIPALSKCNRPTYMTGKSSGVEIEPCDKVSPATSKREGAESSLTSRGTWFILWEMELKLCL